MSQTIIFGEKSKNVDLMHINHFALYCMLGLIYPDKYIIVLIISIIWELFEYIISYNKKLNTIVKKYWFVPERYWNEIKINKIIDLIVNFLGYYVGSLLYKFVK